jgi:hypothetical protein
LPLPPFSVNVKRDTNGTSEQLVPTDPHLLPAYTYAKANPLVFGDFDGRKPSSLQNRLGGLAGRALGVSGAFGARQQTPAAFGRGPNSSKAEGPSPRRSTTSGGLS